MYPMGRQGSYRIRVGVYFTQLDQFFNSKEETVQIADGRKLWHQVLGVPEGQGRAGTYRRFTLLTFHSGAEKELYIRVQDERSGAVLTTYSLGQVIMIRDPHVTIDTSNRLHILHMARREPTPTASSESTAKSSPAKFTAKTAATGPAADRAGG